MPAKGSGRYRHRLRGRRLGTLIVAALSLTLLLTACGRERPAPTATTAATASVRVQAEPTPTATAVESTPTSAATATARPATVTPTAAPTATPSPTAGAPTAQPPAPSGPAVLVTADLLNVRAGPGTDYPVVGQAVTDQRFPISGRNEAGDWWRIDFDGFGGWVYAPLVATEGEVTAVAMVAETPPSRRLATPAVQVYETTISIPTYPYADFTEEAVNPDLNWPYRRFDRAAYEASDPQPLPQTYTLVVLENEYLRLTFLPELGGRLYQAIFKPTGSNEFYQNSVIKPSPWGPAEQGGWIAAGGMEWGLPVAEHGYAWGDRWGHIVLPYDPSRAGVTLFMPYEDHLRAEVEITLRAGEAAFTLQPRIVNPTDRPVDYQFWLDAMLAPGPANSAGPDLRFLFPTDEVTVHSRGDIALPQAGQPMAWPLYRGVDYSRLGNWKQWMGFFERPAGHGPFAGVYDLASDEGMVRIYPAAGVPGSKGFTPGWSAPFDPLDYTDDGSLYVEVHGGVTPTFADQATLAAGDEFSWQESWYPVAGIGGITYADGNGAVHLASGEDGLEVGLFPVRTVAGRVIVSVDDQPVLDEVTTIDPGRPFRQVIEAENLPAGAIVTVTLLDADSTPVINYSQAMPLP